MVLGGFVPQKLKAFTVLRSNWSWLRALKWTQTTEILGSMVCILMVLYLGIAILAALPSFPKTKE